MARFTARLQTPQEIEAEMEQQKQYEYEVIEDVSVERTFKIYTDKEMTEQELEDFYMSGNCSPDIPSTSREVIHNFNDHKKIEVALEHGDEDAVSWSFYGDFKK